MIKRLVRAGVVVTGLAVAVVLPLGVIIQEDSASGGSAQAAPTRAAGIPPVLAQAYQQAAAQVTRFSPGCRGLTWPMLAGIGQVESGQASGRSIGPDGEVSPPIYGPLLDGSGVGGNTTAIRNATPREVQLSGGTAYARAAGPLQIMPTTWLADGVTTRAGAVPDPQNVFDAALTTAVLLCGKGRDLTSPAALDDAVFSYNHSQAYVAEVTGWITRFQQTTTAPAPAAADVPGRAGAVIGAALKMQGVPYSWGGGGPQGPSRGSCCSSGGQDGSTVVGFDCSGLLQYAYAQVGVMLPRSAAQQASVGRRIPASAGLGALRPGDLVFFAYVPGNDQSIFHVGIYLGGGNMIAAPRPGKRVSQVPVASMGTGTYAGGAAIL